MTFTSTFSSLLVMVFIILLLSIVFHHKDKKAVSSKAPRPSMSSTPLDKCTIEELARRIATEPLNEKELLSVVRLVAKEHKFPGKNSGKSSEFYLKFVYQFCLNPHANGATIVKMTDTLKTVNTPYKPEIEANMRLAVEERDRDNS